MKLLIIIILVVLMNRLKQCILYKYSNYLNRGCHNNMYTVQPACHRRGPNLSITRYQTKHVPFRKLSNFTIQTKNTISIYYYGTLIDNNNNCHLFL